MSHVDRTLENEKGKKTPYESAPAPIQASGLITRFVVVPVAIVVLGVLLFLAYSAATHSEKSLDDLLKDVRGRGVNMPWQAAFELSRRLHEGGPGVRDQKFISGAVNAFEGAKGSDPRIRCFLALALANLKNEKALDSLTKALQDPNDEIRIYAIIALGLYGDPASAVDLYPFLNASDMGQRKAAVCSLGLLGNRAAIEKVAPLLKDTHEELRWNVALALARLGDKRAVPVLRTMLDRSHLAKLASKEKPKAQHTAFGWWGRAWPLDNPVKGFDEEQQARVIKHAISALTDLKDRESLEFIRPLLKDQRDDIQWEAAESLAEFGDPSGAFVFERGLDRRGLLRRGYGHDAAKAIIKTSMVALGKIKPLSAIPALENVARQDPDPEIRKLAEQTARSITGARK